MGFWPFGGGKKPRTANAKKHAREQSLQSDPSENMGGLEKASTDIRSDTTGSTKKDQPEKSRRLSKTRIPSTGERQKSQTAPLAIPTSRRHSRNAPPLSEKQIYQQNPISQSSLGPDKFNVVRQPPTLYARKSDQESNIARRRSSKRKAEDHAREREVKAMSSSPIPIPGRPQSFYGSGLLQRETRDVPSGPSRKFGRPTSQVSLPLHDALPDVDNVPNQNSFKIGMFAALSPRPTIKYDANPRHAPGKQPHRPTPVTRPPILEEEEGADKKRIDELADDLDAKGLHELMERDKRRKERKRKQEQARLDKKLQRRADRQREEEARKARTEEYVSASASRVEGLGIGPHARQTSDREETEAGPSGTHTQRATDPFSDPKPRTTSPVIIRNPFEDEKDMDIMQDAGSDAEPEPEPAIPARSPLRKIRTDTVEQTETPVQVALSPPVSPAPRAVDRQSMSQGSLLNREATTDMPENASLTGAASDHSSQRLSSWTAFFTRGTRRKLSSSFQGRSTPSEFSNTSRESFAARKQPPPVVPSRTFKRADSATPQRTMSKFREDLPELPISPPDSRMQSPEAVIPPARGTFNQAATVMRTQDRAEGTEQSAYTPSSPIPTSGIRPENKPSMELDVPTSAKPEMILSQSLASVDSEGSWLSGKPLNRRSGASQRLKPSRSSLTRTIPGAFDGANDEGSLPESPTLRDTSKQADDAQKIDELWHAGLGRQPTLVRQASRARSKEGLLNEYAAKETQASTSGSEADSPELVAEEPEPEVTLMRARSVDYKGHARHISAGSARLLDLRRSSVNSESLLSQQSGSAKEMSPAS